ncbi:MAG: AI-2E family transporter [Halopenitus sp.]
MTLEWDRGRLAWWLFGAVLAVVVGFVALSFLGTIVFAVFLYYATRPVYRRLRLRIHRPNVAAAVSIFALALPALLLVGYTVIVAASQFQRLTAIQLPELDDELLRFIAEPGAIITADLRSYISPQSLGRLLDTLSSAADTLILVGVGVVQLFLVIALAFYLLRDDAKIGRWFLETFDRSDGVVVPFLTAVDDDFQSIFFGNILNAFIIGAIGAIIYSLLNLFAPEGMMIPAAALIGLLAGVASLVPVVGMKLVYVPVAIFLVGRTSVLGEIESLWFVGLFLVISFVFVDSIPDLILRPYVSGRSLHVGAVMVAYTVGPLLFGWYGIFLMPMLLVVVVRFAQIVLPELVQTGSGSEKLDDAAANQPHPRKAHEAADAGQTDGEAATEEERDVDRDEDTVAGTDESTVAGEDQIAVDGDEPNRAGDDDGPNRAGDDDGPNRAGDDD